MVGFAPQPFRQCYSPSNAYGSYAKFHENLTNHLVADTTSQTDGHGFLLHIERPQES